MGIGREIAARLAKEGADVVLFDLSDKVFETAEEIKKLGVRVLAFRGDVTNRQDLVPLLLRHLWERLERVYTGVVHQYIDLAQLLHRLCNSLLNVMNVNVKGTFYFTKAVAPIMVKNRYGRIINIVSIATIVGFPALTHLLRKQSSYRRLYESASSRAGPVQHNGKRRSPRPYRDSQNKNCGPICRGVRQGNTRRENGPSIRYRCRRGVPRIGRG